MWDELDLDQLHRALDNIYTSDTTREYWTISSGICIEDGCGIGASVDYHVGDLNIFSKPVENQSGDISVRFFWMISGTGPGEGYWEDYSWDAEIRDNRYGYDDYHAALSDLFTYIYMKKEIFAKNTQRLNQ